MTKETTNPECWHDPTETCKVCEPKGNGIMSDYRDKLMLHERIAELEREKADLLGALRETNDEMALRIWHEEYKKPEAHLPERFVRRILAEAGKGAEAVVWPDLLREAENIVRNKPIWKRFIDGTPLSNDIPVWMANFAANKCDNMVISPPVSEPGSERPERCENEKPTYDELEARLETEINSRIIAERGAAECRAELAVVKHTAARFERQWKMEQGRAMKANAELAALKGDGMVRIPKNVLSILRHGLFDFCDLKYFMSYEQAEALRIADAAMLASEKELNHD